MSIGRQPIRPDKVRSIKGDGFSYIPHGFLRDGFLASLNKDELLLYFFLILAADRHGMSFYSYEKICSLLLMDIDSYIRSRNSLIQKELIAFDGYRFQVLSLPEKPMSSTENIDACDPRLEEEDPARIRAVIRQSLGIEKDQ